MIAGEVRRYRKARGMSVRQLSEAAERLGLPVPQPVLSNLELSRRETISVAEWLLLSAALQVPPLLLLFPVGRVDLVEPAPGVEVSPLAALHWLETGGLAVPVHPNGSSGFVMQPVVEPSDEDALLIRHYRWHQELIGAWEGTNGEEEAVRRFKHGEEQVAELARVERERRVTLESLRNLRAILRSRGLTPPELPRHGRRLSALRHALGEDDGEVESS